MEKGARFRLDDLRRLATALGVGSGLAAPRASALAGQRLWYDAAGAPRFGIASLPDWLDRIGRGEIDPKAEGRVESERGSTAVLDGKGGLPPLILARAAALASEKARESGVGVVRVHGIGPAGPASAIVAELATGPLIGLALGPGPSIALALPMAGDLPEVFDPALEGRPAAEGAPWSALVADGDWIIQATAVPAFGSLEGLRERVQAAGLGDSGRLRPEAWDAQRREARERGIPLRREIRQQLRGWAERLGVDPGPWASILEP